MIRGDELTEIGVFYKPHGIKGEISTGFDYDLDPADLRCIVMDVDGIFVPFFIESWRARGAGRLLIKLDGIDNESSAAAFSNRPIYALTSELPEADYNENEDGIYLYDLEGYAIMDGERTIGIIENIDDSTENILFHVAGKEGQMILVPFAEDWIESYDIESKTIKMNMPDGILTLND